MFCPGCEDEFQDGVRQCPDCGLDLVARPPAPPAPPPPPPPLEVVTVLATGDETLIEIARSLLDGAGIGYWVKGEGLQSLFGAGLLGSGFNVAVGPILLQVDAADAEEAKALLEGVEPPLSEDAGPPL